MFHFNSSFSLFATTSTLLISHLNPGSGSPAGVNNVVQWQHKDGEASTSNMGYNNGRLLVKRAGHYYLYSKVTINAAEECSLIQHKVMKDTKAYDKPIELMKSKRLVKVPLLTSFLSWHMFLQVPS